MTQRLRADLADLEADIAITAQALGDMRTRRDALRQRIAIIEAGQTAMSLDDDAPETAQEYAARREAFLRRTMDYDRMKLADMGEPSTTEETKR